MLTGNTLPLLFVGENKAGLSNARCYISDSCPNTFSALTEAEFAFASNMAYDLMSNCNCFHIMPYWVSYLD